MVRVRQAPLHCCGYDEDRTAYLWQGRFFSSALDETYLWAAIRYVEQNPVRARVVRRARPLYSHSAVQPVEEIRRDMDARLAELHRAADRLYDRWTAGLTRG